MAQLVYSAELVGIDQTFEFSYARFLYLKSPDLPDWSTGGDFVEVDCQLLVKLDGDLWRLVDGVPIQLTTREVYPIPTELARSTLKVVLLGDVNDPVNLEIWVDQSGYLVSGWPLNVPLRFEFTPSVGQVDFVLPNWSGINQAQTTVYLNGVLADDTVDYQWGVTALEWLGVILEPTDQLTVLVVMG